MKNIISDIGYK